MVISRPIKVCLRTCDGAAPGLIELPHSWQNFALGGFLKPHFAHGIWKAAPHSMQNFAAD